MAEREMSQSIDIMYSSKKILIDVPNMKEFAESSRAGSRLILDMPNTPDIFLTDAKLVMYTSRDGLNIYIFGRNKNKLESKDAIDVTFSVIDNKNQIFFKRTTNLSMNPDANIPRNFIFSLFSRDEFIANYDKLLLQPNNVLRLICKVKNFNSSYCKISKSIVEKPEVILDFQNLWETQKLCDVEILTADGLIMKAHTAVLAASSPVFLRMFDYETTEKSEMKVEMTDVEYDYLKALLEFLYTGKVPETSDSAAGVMIVANKYDIVGLKLKCEKILSKYINDDTAIYYMILADTYHAECLKMRAMHYSINHVRSIIKSSDFTNLKTTHPQLLEEMFCRLALKNQ